MLRIKNNTIAFTDKKIKITPIVLNYFKSDRSIFKENIFLQNARIRENTYTLFFKNMILIRAYRRVGEDIMTNLFLYGL